jgi:hypothetical protein
MNADKKVRCQESGVRSEACRGDLALIPHLSSIIRNSNREVREIREERPILWEASPDADTAEGREKNISPQRSQRARREGQGQRIILNVEF